MARLLLIIAAILAIAMPAHATLQLSSNVNGTLFSCFDNQAGCDTNPAIGTLQLSDQVIGGVQVNGSIQTSTGTVLNPGPSGILNTSSLSIINNNTGTVPITFTVGDNNFTGPRNIFSTSTSGVWQQAIGSNLTVTFYDDPANVQGADAPGDTPGTLLDTFSSTAVLLTDSFSHNASGAVSDGALYSMTESVTGNLTAGGELLNRGQTEIKSAVVPEPGSLAMLGTLLGVGGFVGWFRRRKSGKHEFAGMR